MERKTSHTQADSAGKARQTPTASPAVNYMRPGETRLATGVDKPRLFSVGADKGTATTSTSARRRRRKRKVSARFYRFVACLVALFLVVSYSVAFWRIIQVERKISSMKSQIAAAQARNDQLKKELEVVTSDKYVEETARQELGLVRQGETAWVVVKPDDPQNPFRVEKRRSQGPGVDMEGW